MSEKLVELEIVQENTNLNLQEFILRLIDTNIPVYGYCAELGIWLRVVSEEVKKLSTVYFPIKAIFYVDEPHIGTIDSGVPDNSFLTLEKYKQNYSYITEGLKKRYVFTSNERQILNLRDLYIFKSCELSLFEKINSNALSLVKEKKEILFFW